MDQLIGDGQHMNFDKKTISRLQELELLEHSQNFVFERERH